MADSISPKKRATPVCTYRLQLSSQFTFDDAAGCAEYLATLGATDVYCSPIFQAVPGSTHGYDVVDPTRLNDELGGEAGFRRLVAALNGHGMSVLMDIVPNHMATAGRANPWWWDILKNGPSSRYANYFDINWDPPITNLKGKVLLGVLADRYGRELDGGALILERQEHEVVVRYHDTVFPISDQSLDGVDIESVQGDKDAFDSLLERQHYRLAYWRTAQEELNYRRFFTIDTLIGLHVEHADVLEDSHRLVFELVSDGSVAGLRIDHVDGLRDPEAYLKAVRARAPDAYIVLEKVLAYDEELPDFPVQGTTGYDFMAHVDGLYVDERSEEPMTALYHAFTGDSQSFSNVVLAAKHEIMLSELSPDLERLTTLLVGICWHYRRQRDRTRRELKEAVREVAAALTVYRTYVRREASSESDHRRVKLAVEEATRRNSDIDPELLSFIGELLLMEHEGEAATEFAARFQQFTPAVMAKCVEDTAFYRFNRLASLNEVGGDPGTFGQPVAAFHAYCSRMAAGWPATMLTLSTHDTKRSSDVRSRLSLLSEIPAEWDAAVRGWAEHNERHRSQGYPDRGIEYLMYQTLVGAWPIDAARLAESLLKAAREAKMHTSWVKPIPLYEDALAQFCDKVMADAEFLGDLQTFIGRQQLVALGRTASLAQTALLLTCPGVPDLYQGTEIWDLSLVDPDNRRPVDYEHRRRLLSEVRTADAAAVLARADEGAPKLWLIARLLEQRRLRPDRFNSQSYAPVTAAGAKARHVICFVRDRLLVVVPRLLAGLGGDWGDTTVVLPRGQWKDVLTGREESGGVPIAVSVLLQAFPVAVLANEQSG